MIWFCIVRKDKKIVESAAFALGSTKTYDFRVIATHTNTQPCMVLRTLLILSSSHGTTVTELKDPQNVDTQ